MIHRSVSRLTSGLAASRLWRLPAWAGGLLRSDALRPAVAVSLGTDAALVRINWSQAGTIRARVAWHADTDAGVWRRWRQQGWFGGGARLVVVLPPRLRATTVMARPDVPDTELVDAVRWQLAASLDYPAADALIDVLPLPQLSAAPQRQVMAVSARLDAVREHIAPLLAAGLRPDAIDIDDTAQRNLALHGAGGAAAVATLGFSDREALLTVVADGELVVSRAIALPDMQTQAAAACERLTVQVQRTLDAFERQATRFAVKTVQLLPGPLEEVLDQVLAPLMMQRLQRLHPGALLGDAAAERWPAPAHRFSTLVGAALGPPASKTDEPAPAAAPVQAATPVAVTLAAPAPAAIAAAAGDPGPAAARPAAVAQAVLADAARAATDSGLTLAPREPTVTER